MNKAELFKTNCSIPTLGEHWRKRVALITGTAEVQLTPKEFGQLTALKKHLKTETVDVVNWVLDNWSRFSEEAIRGGPYTAPSTPHIGFFLKHHYVALLMMGLA